MAAPANLLYITYIEKENACLKIWGQTDRNLPIVVEKALSHITPIFEQGHHIPPAESIYNGMLVCAKFKDGLYYRARITNTNLLHQGLVEVHFIDYGNREFLPFLHTRLFTDAALKNLMTIPPQAKEFILALVTHTGTAWDDDVLALINTEIRYVEMQYNIVAQVGPYTLIRLLNGNSDDVALNFISRRLVLSISLHTQEMILHSYLSRSQSTHQNVNVPAASPSVPAPGFSTPPQPSSPTLLNYKAISLEPGSEHAVYVSYVSDGPLQFSVQLKRMEDTLVKLMNELDKMALQPLEETVIPGTVCVAKCIEDGYFCRAVVTSMVDSQYKVFFVDFGNTEVVPLDNLYQIPFKFVIPKVMAMRFALAGLEKSNVTLEMKCAFKDFVCNRPLTMRVAPVPRRSALPTCELWDEKGVYALDVMKKAAVLSYPDALALNRGLSQDVRVSYVYSCNRFFVQLKSKEADLNALMEQLQVVYNGKEQLEIAGMKEGTPCCALYEVDQQWYRAQIISLTPSGVKVRYVDYGNEEIVAPYNLRRLEPEHVTCLKPQAIECCLNGYQNMAQDQERDNLLEELILEKDFSMKVFDAQDGRALVELFDSDRYNVSSLLLEKIALTRSQVSPMLIQDGLKFEHRKRGSFEENQKSWGGRRDAKDNWRQNRSPRSDHSNEDRGRGDFRTQGQGFRERDNRSDDGKQQNFRERRDFSSRPDGGVAKAGFRERRERNDFSPRNNDRSPQQPRERFGSTNSSESFGGGGRQKKFEHKREGSEKSWSDNSSEKSWKKGPRTPNTRNDHNKSKYGGGGGGSGGNFKKFDNKRPNDNFNNRQRQTFTSDGGGDTWNIGAVADLPDLAPNDAVYEIMQLSGMQKNVTISWFHNPSHFYCQLQDMSETIKTMMDDIQNTYVNRRGTSATVGAPVVAVFPEDNVLYRARVLENHFAKYRVFYVDFGNTATVDEVYAIQRRFMELPAQAVRCCLRGIAPLEHEWSAADVYGDCFGKDSFACDFLSYENGHYLVDLMSDNQSVADTLIATGLAKPECAGASQIEIDILKGQQLRVCLVSVKNLSDFQVFVVPDLTLSCTAHNLGGATQTYENVLQEQLNSSLIIYVDDVVDGRLVVTVYDTQGYKLTLLEPDEGAFESVEPLCPLPVFYSTFYGWVSHVTAQSIFVQQSGFADTIAQLLDQLYERYNEPILEVPIIPEVDVVYAVRSLDGNWYRGRTVSVEEENATFLYVDYGNTESVAITEVRELDQQFLELHMLALEVYVPNPAESLLETEITLKLHYNEGWYGEIISEAPPAPTKPQPEAVDAPSTAQDHQNLDTSQNGVSVTVTHLDSPSEFYLQLSAAAETVEKLQSELQAAAPNLPDLENPSAGVLCAAPYSLDQQWYRAQVLDADADITTVRFVDYGNTDVLENGVTSVKTLTPELLMLEQYARRCSLSVRPFEEEWSPVALQRFEELTSEAALTAEIISQDEKTTYVELFANGQNVSEILINEQLAVRLETQPESLTTGFVSHLNSPSEFWIQLESSVADLEWIADQLSAAETWPELEDLTPGSLCAAVFPEDDNWYRARILSNTVAGLEVLFIDYGNSCTCTCMRTLPEDLALMPALAQKCSLQRLPEVVEQWSPQACERFREIAADGVTIFNVKKLTTGETAVVDLLLNGESVGYMLLPKTVNCFVTKFESLQSFHIRKHDDGEELNTVCKLEPLAGVQWNEESDRAFCDLNKEGKTLFQVEFVTSDLVRLYIDERDIRTYLGGAKTTLVATPKKYVESRNDDISDLVEEIVENVGDLKDRDDGVQDILSGIVDDAVGEMQAVKNVKEIISDIVNEAADTEQVEEKNINEKAAHVQELLNEIVDDSTKEKQVGDDSKGAQGEVKKALDDIVDGSIKVDTKEVSGEIASEELPSEIQVDKTDVKKMDSDIQGQSIKPTDATEFDSKVLEIPSEITAKKVLSETKDVCKDDTNREHTAFVKNEEILSKVETNTNTEQKAINTVEDTVKTKTESWGKVEKQNGAIHTENTQETLRAVADTLNEIVEGATTGASGDTTVKTQDLKKISRPSSRSSGRYEVEERVVPGAISRPRTPDLEEAH